MSNGPFIYTKVTKLEGKPKVGGGQCAVLVQWYSPLVGKAATWREGIKVKGSPSIATGTAIATFVDGVYPNKAHGNHAGYYITQNPSGIYIMDQFTGKSTISMRQLKFKGKNSDGTYIDPSNNGDAFSVIIHE